MGAGRSEKFEDGVGCCEGTPLLNVVRFLGGQNTGLCYRGPGARWLLDIANGAEWW